LSVTEQCEPATVTGYLESSRFWQQSVLEARPVTFNKHWTNGLMNCGANGQTGLGLVVC